MQIASTISTPNRAVFQVIRATTSFRRSPLNPQRGSHVSAVTLKSTISTAFVEQEKPKISTRKHLFNLERLLQKGPQPSPSQNSESELGEVSPEIKGRSIFGGLNLGEIWPARSKAEEMSPRNLNRLQRLLSKSPEYSPRNNLGERWEEYHGQNDWAGLLDPLDENLRREVVRYGEFIQAAYHAFHSNPATSADEPSPSPRHVALPDPSYKVTKSLYATSSIGLPCWVDAMAPDLGWMTQRSSWIGYVAVCENEREIARMGRRDIVISFRGTSTCLEWAENLRAMLVKTSDADEDANSKVECGFWSLYKTPGSQMPSLSEAVVEEVRRLVDLYKGERLSITVTGHSLGAALALLTADELSTCAPDIPPVAVFSFGSPHVGNRGFANRIKANGVKVLRVVNTHDVITKVPGVFVSEGSGDQDHNGGGNIAHVLNEMPWAYSHVGSELRVDSKTSPYLKPNADVACCHDLEAYLHLVDGFIASNCPFRANAKRSIAKLLNEQGSNVKKLYTNKALTVSLDHKVGSSFCNKS